ncbi:MAG: YceI family protein [Algicola sp.]|nr:YceI family protein [Algicola sp.]
MKKIVLILIIISGFAFTTNEVFNDTSVLITPESQLLIKGKTNVSKFKCEFNINQINEPIPLYYQVKNNKMVFEKAKLKLDNQCFDCGSKGINKDFRALLKSESYPEIELHLKEIKNIETNPSKVNALLELHIAGKSKSYLTPLTIDNSKDICVSGLLKLNITDFGLIAPKKALGLVVVSDEIEINFELIFKELKN